MIVSIATVVLPVLRSPMISSRWPRPIGVIESMALMPVCSGSCTGLRPMIPGAWTSMRRCRDVGERALAVDRLAEGVDHPAEQAVADGHREDVAGGLDRLALLDGVHVAEHDGADRLLVEVQGQADGAVLELEHLVHRAVGQARHAGDAVAHLDDPADLGRGDVGREARQVLAQGGGDVVGVDGELGHVLSPVAAQFALEERCGAVRGGGGPSRR